MYRRRFISIFIISFLLSRYIAGQSPTLVILNFEARGIPTEESRVFTEHLQAEIFQSSRYSLLAVSDVQEELEKAGYTLDSCSAIPCLTEVGRLSGSRLAVGGVLTKIDDSYSVTVRMVDVEKNQLARMFIYRHVGDIVSLLSTGVEAVAERLIAPITAPTPATIGPVHTSDTTDNLRDTSATAVHSYREPGGFGPALASCLLGPRVGLEMNEGIEEIHLSEWIALGGSIISGSATGILTPIGNVIYTGTRAYMAYEMGGKHNGLEGALAAFCIGPRVGNELHYRKIRNKEWLLLIPCVNIYPLISIPLEAYHGKTMTEIEISEGLRK